MKKNLEVTFMDGTKALYHAEKWSDLKVREDGMVQVEYKGQAFAWYPIRNIKSIITVEEGESN